MLAGEKTAQVRDAPAASAAQPGSGPIEFYKNYYLTLGCFAKPNDIYSITVLYADN